MTTTTAPMTGAATELLRRRDNARAQLEDAARRAAEGDAAASVDVERHAAAVAEYGAALTELARTPVEPRHSFFADVVARSTDRAADQRLRDGNVDYRSTSGNYGGLIVPQYLTANLASSGHSRRPLCDLLAVPLPAQGAPVVLARVSTGVTAEVQSNENGAVTADDPATVEITLPVRTVAALVDVSAQIVNRADPAGLDAMVARELVGAVDALEEAEVIDTLLTAAGVPSFTLTSSTAGDVLDALARTSAAVTEATGTPPDVVVMAPRRWRHLLANAGDYGAAVTPTSVLGMTVAESPSVPLTESTNQDRVVVIERQSVHVAEAPVEVALTRQGPTTAPTFGARLRAHRYFAAGVIRATGVHIITGSGLANPY